MNVLTREEMYFFDNYTIEKFGISSRVLMEIAGKGCFDFIHKKKYTNSISIVCGSGNNGGDGFVIARWLHKYNYKVNVVLLGNSEKMSRETLENYKLVEKLKIPILKISPEKEFDSKFLKEIKENEKDSLIVDALFGIGFRGKMRSSFGKYIREMNRKNVPIISIDIASGLDANTGKCDDSVLADYSLAISKPKIGQFLEKGKIATGKLEIIPIGIPYNIIEKKFKATLINDENVIFPKRCNTFHKGNYGKIGIIAGSKGLTGAGILSSKSALRSGAGLVTLFHPESLDTIFETSLTEVMTFPFSEVSGKKAFKDIREKIANLDSILIGPGIGKSSFMKELLKEILGFWKKKIVIDADALNLISENKDLFNLIEGDENVLLTPHLGEFSRLSGYSVDSVIQDPIGYLSNFVQNYKVKVLLKSSTTIFASQDKILIDKSGNDSLATGGSGDVLAGAIIAFIGQKLSLENAAISASFLLGKTAEKLGKENYSAKIIPSDIIENFFNF